MAIRDGRGTNRRHGHNYIREQAEARLQEVIRPAQERGLNALGVDSFEVMYFRRSYGSMPCSCSKSPNRSMTDHNAVDESNALPMNIQPQIDDGDEEIVIEHRGALIGTGSSVDSYDDHDYGNGGHGHNYDDEEVIEDDDVATSHSNLFALSSECGICYRNGVLPGYELYGHDRKVMTGSHVINTYGYNLDQTSAPHQFNMLDPEEAFVDFVVEVPKYFQGMRYSVRNNLNHLADEVLYLPDAGNTVLTLAAVRASAGRSLTVRVRAEQFTHVVIDFNLGLDPIRAALAQDTKATDWTMFDNLGTISMILPMTIDSVETSDVIYVPTRRHTFKVSDVTYMRTARNKNIDWQVQARVLQPQEGLKRIYQANTLR